MDEEIAVIIEQYRDHAESRLPGLGRQWQSIAATPEASLNQLLEQLHGYPDPTGNAAAPIAVSLLQVWRYASNLRPPTVVQAPDDVQVLFSGDLNPIQPPPSNALWLKPGECVPDHARDGGTALILPHRVVPFRANQVVIRTHHGEHRLLRHAGGSVRLISPGPTVARVRQAVDPFPQFKPRGGKPESDDRIAVVMEQYRDHTEAYLPDLDRTWHTTDITPDGALESLMQLIQQQHPAIPSPTAPIAVSLVTVHPNATTVHPATVERAPRGAMVLFLGRLLPGEAVPPEAQRLRPGDPIPDHAPPGQVFLVPPMTEGLDDEGRCPPDAVVLHTQPGEHYRVLHHAGPVISMMPARLVRMEPSLWGQARHIEVPVN